MVQTKHSYKVLSPTIFTLTTALIASVLIFSSNENAVAAKASVANASKKARSSSTDSTDLLYEGYAKVMAEKNHVGFIVSRYSIDKKTGEFRSTYFLKTTPEAGDVTESLNARSTSGFEPIDYHYTSLVGKQSKTIDAKFEKGKMKAQILDGAKASTIEKSIPKGTFLSTFLPYVMLNGKEGLKPTVNYAYNAVAEEDGGIYPGEAFVKGTETFKNLECFKIMNTFKKEQFVSFVTAGGELLATKAPASGISTELVATFQEATAGLDVNQKTLEIIFGGLPAGQKNIMYKLASAPNNKSAPKPDADAMIPEGDSAAAASSSTGTTTPPTKKGVDGGAPQDKQDSLLAEPPAEPMGPNDTPKKRGIKGGQGFLIKPGAPDSSDDDKKNKK